MGNNEIVDDEIVYHLRRSFTRGDSNWLRQFWYARGVFMVGNRADSDAVFADLKRADLPNRDRVEPRAPWRDETGRNLRFAGRVERIFSHYAFVVRDADQARLFLRSGWCRSGVWSTLRNASRVSFVIAFNYEGPLATDVTKEI
jgi:hypothetical protein